MGARMIACAALTVLVLIEIALAVAIIRLYRHV